MRSMLSVLALSLVLQGQTSLNRPDQIKSDAEKELHKYFPRAVVMVSPQRQAIFAFTCSNLGESAVREIKPFIDQSSEVQQLKQVIQRTNTETYQVFALVFDQYVIQLKRDGDHSELLPIGQLDDYKNLYVQYCGSEQKIADTQGQAETGYIWLGVFEIAAEWSDGLKRTFVSKDTLGVYTESDFDVVREEELKHREQIIRWFLEQQEIKVTSIQLKSIEKINLDKATAR